MKKLNYLILLFLVSAFSFANVSPKEKEALIALYNSTNGKDWNSAWDINASENTWYGVKIENNQIVELSLQFNNLDGNLPQEIGDLVNLRKINLGFNKLKGKLPTSISNLKELISLELFMNSFEGNIPTELGELKKLEKQVKNSGLTIIPLLMFTTEKGLAKVEIALCKGKKLFDKRETLKDRDNQRDLSRIKKDFNK